MGYEGTKACICFWHIIVFVYLIVMIAIFSAEIKQLKALKTTASKYDGDQLLGFSDSLLNAYQLASLEPIQELYVILPNSTCVPGDELLNLDIWNSKPICSYPYFSNYSIGSCPGDTSKNKKANRYTIGDQRFYLTNWGDVQFCVRRFRSSYKEWYVRNSFDCNAGYYACKNNVCVKGTTCPINNLLVIDSSNSTLQLNTSEYSYSLIGNINSTRRLYASRNYNSEFIIDLAVGINGKPCIHELEAVQRVNNLDFLKTVADNCRNYGSDDNIYSQIDIQQEWDYYDQNNLKYIMAGLSLENYISHETALLYAVTRTANSCPSGNFMIDSDNSDIFSFLTLRNGANTYGLVYICITLIIFFIHILGLICGERKLVDSIVISLILLVFIFVEGIMCPISLSYLGKIVKNDNFLNKIISAQCFQIDGYNRLFQDYGDEILIDSSQSYRFIHTILYFSLVVFLLDVLYLVDKIVYNMYFNREEGGVLEEVQCCDNINNRDDDCNCDLDCDDCIF